MRAMRLDGVGRRYGMRGPWVLRDVCLDVPARSLLRVDGPNGSGKSTLLRLLAGIDAPTTGRVTGRPRTGYVPERFSAAIPFTAAGYLTHLGRIHGLRGSTAASRAMEWLERFGASGHARTLLAELSKGTSQKVAVTQVLLADPELLVLDEAWTGLDGAARDVLDRAVAERVARGGTVVFVDHDPRRLAGVADSVFRVDGTRLVPAEGRAPGTSWAAGDQVAVVVVDVETAQGAAEVPGDLPGAPAAEAGPPGITRLTVPAAYSDALLHALLTARPPWHIRAVTPAGPAGSRGAPGSGPTAQDAASKEDRCQ